MRVTGPQEAVTPFNGTRMAQHSRRCGAEGTAHKELKRGKQGCDPCPGEHPFTFKGSLALEIFVSGSWAKNQPISRRV